MTLRIRQIVFAARDLPATVAQIEDKLGLKVAYRDPQVAEFGLENVVMPLGDQFLEVVSPIRADTAAGRHLERLGDSAYMLILQTDDLARDRERMDRLGVRIVWQSHHPDISSVHLHPKDIGAAIVSVDQPIPPGSWRWAGPNWDKYVSANGAQRVQEATISARDPAAMSRRWAEVLGTQRPTESRGAWRIEIDAGALNFVQSGDGADKITDYKVAMRSSSADVALCGTRFHLGPMA